MNSQNGGPDIPPTSVTNKNSGDNNIMDEEKTSRIQEPINEVQHTVEGIIGGPSPSESTKEITTNIVNLDTKNYGAPPENAGIEIFPYGIVSPPASRTEPQTWQDKNGNWFYNFPGVLLLAKVLGRRIPNIEELIATINAHPENFAQGVGYRSADSGQFDDLDCLLVWSSYAGSKVAHVAYLVNGAPIAHKDWTDRGNGMSARLIIDQE